MQMAERSHRDLKRYQMIWNFNFEESEICKQIDPNSFALLANGYTSEAFVTHLCSFNA